MTNDTKPLGDPTLAGPPLANKKRGRWRKGVSGNPEGRPKNTAELIRTIRSAESRYAPAVIEAVRVAALGGDMSAAKIYLDRILGPPTIPPDAVDAQSLVRRVVIEYQKPRDADSDAIAVAVTEP